MSQHLAGRRFLITGGTGGVGMEAATAVLDQGGEVLLGTRQAGHYEAAAAVLGNSGRVHPFIADIADAGDAGRQIALLVDQRLEPTDVIHCAAGGLESLLRDLVRISMSLRRLDGQERDAAHTSAIEQLGEMSAQSRPVAMSANYTSPSSFLDGVAKRLPVGATITYFTSLWSSFEPHPQVPAYYRALAESKHEMERWLEQRAAADWRHLTTLVVSSPVVSDTRMGEIIDRHCASLMPEADRLRWRATFVTCRDVVRAMLGVIGSPDRGTGFTRLFLPGDGRVVAVLEADDPVLRLPVAFASNSPVWASEAQPSAG